MICTICCLSLTLKSIRPKFVISSTVTVGFFHDRRRNAPIDAMLFLGIIKAHYDIVKTRPSNVNCGNVNAIAIGLTHA